MAALSIAKDRGAADAGDRKECRGYDWEGQEGRLVARTHRVAGLGGEPPSTGRRMRCGRCNVRGWDLSLAFRGPWAGQGAGRKSSTDRARLFAVFGGGTCGAGDGGGGRVSCRAWIQGAGSSLAARPPALGRVGGGGAWEGCSGAREGRGRAAHDSEPAWLLMASWLPQMPLAS
jgi:hypothetical protein